MRKSWTVIPESIPDAYKAVDVQKQVDQVGVSRRTNLEYEGKDYAAGSSYLLQPQLTIATVSRPHCRDRQSTLTSHHENEMDLDLTSELCAMDAMDTDPKLSESIYEPMRALTSLGPPKRFHRTVWRSLTRRLIQSKLMRNGERIGL